MKNINRKRYILPSALVIVMCLTCFVRAAWAWYTNQAAAKVEKIEAATYSVKVEIFDSNNKEVAVSDDSKTSHTIDLTSNSEYKVKLTGSGVASTGYAVISFVDHVTNETKTYYTPAIAPGTDFEFTYQNGVFESVDGMATIQWENVVNTTRDVLSIKTYWGTTQEEVMEENATVGQDARSKPSSTTITTNWNEGYVTSFENAKPYRIITGNNSYTYTDVITIPKKGTKITFTDKNKGNGSASKNIAVISSWTWNEEEKTWEIDKEGAMIPGGQYAGDGQYSKDEKNPVKYACDKDRGYDMLIEKHSTKDEVTSITYTYITSKDNENIRLCYYSKGEKQLSTITSIYSGEIGTAEEIELTCDSEKWLNEQKKEASYENYKALFEGKKISVIGDSYFYGKDLLDAGKNNTKSSENVWPSLLSKKYNMAFNNYGLSGSPISNYASTKTEPAIVDRYSNIAKNNPDILIVEGGRNDFVQHVPIDSETDKYDTRTMKGALRTIFRNLKEDENFKDTLIVGMTCWKSNLANGTNALGYYCNEYGEAFIEVCEEMGIPYINTLDSEAIGVYITNSNFRGRFCVKGGDVSHLNEKGMKLVLPTFEKQLYDLYHAHLNPVQP